MTWVAGRTGWAVVAVAWALTVAASCGRSRSDLLPDAPGGGTTESAGGAWEVEEGDAGGAGAGGGLPSSGGAAGDPGGSGGEASLGGAAPSCTSTKPFCDGMSVRRCADDGQSSVIMETCAASDACVAGRCEPIVCAPNTRVCFDDAVQSCSANGTSRSVLERCGEGRYCSSDSSGAECRDTWCSPGKKLCVDGHATRCNAEGSGPTSGTVDCEELGQVCIDGSCEAPKCEPGKRFCQGDAVYFCADGVTSLPYAECGDNEACEPELGACAALICEPGSRGCDGQRVVTCNALGTAFLHDGTNCQADGKACVDGQCLPRVCEPLAYFCGGSNDLRRCNAMGTSSTVEQACGSYYHCLASNSWGYCAANVCAANQPACVGNAIYVCNAEGSGFTTAPSTPCGEALCESGLCKPKVCDGYQYFCKDGDVHRCQGGLSSSLSEDCGADAGCKPWGSSVACIKFECAPGFKACLQNQLGTCASNGFSLAKVTRDCGSEGQVCVSETGCGAQAIDSFGASEELQSFTSGQLFGNAVDVTSDRVLTKLEANLLLAGTREVRFSVFELAGGAFQARYDKVVRFEAGSGWLGSGDVSYPLRAGRRYLFAISVALGGLVGSYDAAPFPRGPSFGRTVGALSSAYESTVYDNSTSSRAYELRVSTSPP